MPQQRIWFHGRNIIAKDVTIVWVGTNASVPAGWVRDTTYDGLFVKQIATSGTNPSATPGGATTHLHPFQQHSTHTYNGHNHSGSWGTSTNNDSWWTNGFASTGAHNGAGATHNHGSASNPAANITVTNNSASDTSTSANDPLHVTTIFIKSDGSAVGIPVTGVVWFNSTVPAGFSVYGNLDNRLMKGAVGGGDGGTQAGTDPVNHTHTTTAHTHPVDAHIHVVSLTSPPSQTVDWLEASSVSVTNVHGHPLGNSTSTGAITSDSASESTGNGDSTPPWYKLRAGQKTGSQGLSIGVIALWSNTLASIPPRWRLCDGGAGTPNLCQGMYVRGAAADGEIGNTGGATTHTHAAGSAHQHGSTTTHSHTFTGASGTATATYLVQTSGADSPPQNVGHTSATYTSSTITVGTSTANATAQQANSSNDPSFRTAAYIQYIGG